MSTLDKRTSGMQNRIDNLSAEVSTSAGKFTARVSNVTLLGLQLTTGHSAEKGERLSVTLTNHDPEGPKQAVVVGIQVASEVTWSKMIGDTFTWGVRFLYQGVQDMAAFVRFMHAEYGVRLWEWPDKRDHPRVSRKLICYYLDGEGTMQLAMLCDLSVTGIGIVTVRDLPLETTTRFRFGVSEQMLLERKGQVVRTRKMERGFDVGVRFIDMTESEQEELERAVARAAFI